MKGYIHSIQSLGTVDGPGVRTVVFGAGCPLRCAYCHNPDTWDTEAARYIEDTEVYEKVKRFYPYIKDGGVTFSGGEPLCQASFFTSLTRLFHKDGIHVALDTSGATLSEAGDALLRECDLVLLDLKFATDEAYKLYTGGGIASPLRILEVCESIGKPVWIRHVLLPDINDSEADLSTLSSLILGYSCVRKIELLPFKKLCIEKYDTLGIPFPLKDTRAATKEDLERAATIIGDERVSY